MKILVFLCSILLFAADAIAQGLDRASMAILERGVHVDVSAELAPIIANTPSQPSASVLWSDALAVSASPLANEPSGRASITRLMEAALILAGAAPDQLHLDRLASEDILAMQSASGFPDVGDLLIYLLERGPSVRDTFSHESYTAIRAAPDELPYRILQERTDRPYLGLGPEFQAKILDPEHDPVFREPSERAKTRRLNLAALPDIVLAAKAVRATDRARPQERLYPLMIAVHAVDRAFRANSDGFRPVIYSVQTSALRELRAYRGNNPILLSEVQRAEFRVPSTYFFARFFQSAAEAYASAQVPRDDPRGHLWAAWGEALSRFAYGNATGPSFESAAYLLTPNTPDYATIFGLFLRYLPADEAKRLGNTDVWRARISEILGEDYLRGDWMVDDGLTADFSRIMATIGRPDMAAPFLMDQIRIVRKLVGNETSESGRQELLRNETRHLRRLAPFLRDYAYVISFKLSAEREWELRETEGYHRHLDFLDNINADGELVAPGEVVVQDGNRTPYSALHPEEDLATAVAVYGVVDTTSPTSPLPPTPQADRAAIVAGFEDWVRSAMSREQPAPSIVPYLKLIWLEWFSQAFEPLKDPSSHASGFRYRAVGSSQLTELDRVAGLLTHPAATAHQKHLARLFLETRQFLEEMYP